MRCAISGLPIPRGATVRALLLTCVGGQLVPLDTPKIQAAVEEGALPARADGSTCRAYVLPRLWRAAAMAWSSQNAVGLPSLAAGIELARVEYAKQPAGLVAHDHFLRRCCMPTQMLQLASQLYPMFPPDGIPLLSRLLSWIRGAPYTRDDARKVEVLVAALSARHITGHCPLGRPAGHVIDNTRLTLRAELHWHKAVVKEIQLLKKECRL